MRDLLTKYGIPSNTLVAAVNALNEASEETIEGFNREFGITTTGDDALSSARFAADAILRGADTTAKVVAFVGKRMLGQAAALAAPTSVMVVGQPVVDTPTVTIVPVEEQPVAVEAGAEAAPVVKVKGRPGRKRLGNSDMCKAVAAIESAPKGALRDEVLNCIIAAGIKKSSAVVYLWRYNKGERE